MRVRDIVLVIINRCEGQKSFGRTSLQKVAYFVSDATGRDLGHRAHFYGPFSDLVEVETDGLVVSELIEETAEGLGFANRGGFEAKKYEYHVTDEGKKRIRLIKDKYPTEISKIETRINEIIEHAGGLNQKILSPAAKTHYIIANSDKEHVSTADIKSLAKDLGWDLSENQVLKVADLLERLEMIKVVKKK